MTMGNMVTRYWRRILGSSAVYAAAGWAAVEALTTVIERFGMPDWMATLVTALYVAGLPVAVFIVWRTAGEERRLNLPSFVGAMVFLLVGSSAIFWFNRPPPASPANIVAVVPCEFSGNPAHAYRAEGLAEEVHARLSRVDSVKISSWHSSLFVHDRGYGPREIADALNVDRVVKCHMNSYPERIELKTELVDAKAGHVVWTREHDFVAADIGTVVTELAGALLDVLGKPVAAAELERVNDLGTFSPVAYELLLEVNAKSTKMFWSRQGGEADLDEIERLLDRILEIDPNFAAALDLRAEAAALRTIFLDFQDLPRIRTLLEQSREWSLRALELDPLMMGVRGRLADICEAERTFFQEDCLAEEQLRLLREECEAGGDTARGWRCRFELMAQLGEDNRTALDRWLELEPTRINANMQLMFFLSLDQGVGAETLAVLDTLHWLAPDDRRPFGLISNLLREEGRLDEVLAWRMKLIGDEPPINWANRMSRAATDHMNLGLYEQAAVLGSRAWETRRSETLRFLPDLWVVLGQPERAQEVLEWEIEALGAQSARPLMAPAFKFAGLLRQHERSEALYGGALETGDLADLCDGADSCIAWHAMRLVQVKRELGKDGEAVTWLAVAEEAVRRVRAYVRGEPSALRTRAMEAVLAVVQERHADAVAALREAIYAWEAPIGPGISDLASPVYWLEIDSWFGPLRERDDFKALLAEYRANLEPMAARVLAATQTGDWEPIRRRTYELAGLTPGDAHRGPARASGTPSADGG
jgi:TolB-like protein